MSPSTTRATTSTRGTSLAAFLRMATVALGFVEEERRRIVFFIGTAVAVILAIALLLVASSFAAQALRTRQAASCATIEASNATSEAPRRRPAQYTETRRQLDEETTWTRRPIHEASSRRSPPTSSDSAVEPSR